MSLPRERRISRATHRASEARGAAQMLALFLRGARYKKRKREDVKVFKMNTNTLS